MKANSIYKSENYKREILKLYDEKLASLNLKYDEFFVETFAGKTHVIAAGDTDLPSLVLLHGINAGSPVALESVKNLSAKYRIYALDTVGQAGKSAETRLPVKNESYGRWLAEVFDQLNLQTASIVAVSYGSFILGRLIAFQPQRVRKAIFVVPIVVVKGSFFKAVFKLLLPMMKFLKTEKEADLLKFIDAFYTEKDDFSIRLQKATMLGVDMDTKQPPLIKSEEVKDFDQPVYILAAEDDIFAPREKLIKRSREIFKNLAGIEVLPNSKHVPAAEDYNKIEKIIERWLNEI